MQYLSGRHFRSNAHFHYLYTSRSRKKSLLVFIGIVALHLLIIFIAFNRKPNYFLVDSDKTLLRLIQLPIEKTVSLPVPQEPVVNVLYISSLKDIALPDVKDISFENAVLYPASPAEDDLYSLPSNNAKSFKDVFNPVLRKKLQENYQQMPSSKKTGSRTDIYGVTFVDIGDGMCIKSTMPDKPGQPTMWTLPSKCGKNDSEKMMDRVNAEIEARRRP